MDVTRRLGLRGDVFAILAIGNGSRAASHEIDGCKRQVAWRRTRKPFH